MTLASMVDEAFNIRRGRSRRPLPDGLQSLTVFHDEGEPPAGSYVFRVMDEVVRDNLERCRKDEKLAPQASADLAFSADVNQGSRELRAWSALYYTACYSPWFSYSKLQIALKIHTVQQVLRRWVREGLEQLAEEIERQSAIQKKTVTRTSNSTNGNDIELDEIRDLQPPDYTRLVGAEPGIDTILSWLKASDDPCMIGLQGMGGVGKTALAHASATRAQKLGLFEHIIWVSARQERFNFSNGEIEREEAARTVDEVITMIAKKLGQDKTAGHSLKAKIKQIAQLARNDRSLVVIDNLETLAETSTLVPLLYPLTNQLCFLLTSRENFGQFAYVHVLPVQELSEANSITLVNQEIARLKNGLKLNQKELDKIYSIVGGVPLALKLVAAQVCAFPIDEVLRNLDQARTQGPLNLYNYIYRKTWQSLSEPARILLVRAHRWLPPEGAHLDWLRLQAGLEEYDFCDAITELQGKFLLELRRNDQDWLYGIHNLTRTFLNTDLLNPGVIQE